MKLAGLAEEATYQMEDVTFAGDELMNLGFYIDSELHGDYATQRFILNRYSSLNLQYKCNTKRDSFQTKKICFIYTHLLKAA